jgi:hypothetical protein
MRKTILTAGLTACGYLAGPAAAQQQHSRPHANQSTPQHHAQPHPTQPAHPQPHHQPAQPHQPVHPQVQPQAHPQTHPQYHPGTVVPSQRPQGGGGWPAPAVAPSSRPVARVPISGRPQAAPPSFNLSLGTNTVLGQLADGGRIGPKAQQAVKTVLDGEPLTDRQVARLQDLRDDPSLTPKEKAAIASALQEDRLRKALAGGGAAPVGPGPVWPTPVVFDPAPAPSPVYVQPAPVVVPAAAGEFFQPAAPTAAPAGSGVRLSTVDPAGAGFAGGLRRGDVVLSFGGAATDSFEALRDAVRAAAGPAEVVFLNAETGQAERLTVTPADGRIGVETE